METKTQHPTPTQNGIEIDLRIIFNAIISNLWKIIVFTVLCGVIGLCYSKYYLTPKYRASTSIYITNKVTTGMNSINSGDISTSKSLVDSYKVILYTRDTLNEVIKYGNLNRTPGELSSMITAGSVSGTQVLKVNVSSSDPVEAANIANAIAHVIPIISTTIEGSAVTVIEYAIVPSVPYYPSHMQNALTGLAIGFVLSVLVATLFTVLDLTIKDEDDMQHYCSYPLLALVPNMSLASANSYYYKRYYHRYSHYAKDKDTNKNDEENKLIGKDIIFSALEAYKLLRTKLLYSFADDKSCHVIAVSSALSGEGKSLTSVNLAYNLAQLNKRVLLIDCDMHRPSIAKKMSLSKYPGLSEYLTGFLSLPELIQIYKDDVEQTPVYVLAAGKTPPNPVELINSEKMHTAIATLRKEFDYIVLDMPPVCDVSDALSASKLADGVLMVVRQNYGSHIALRDAIQQFEFVDAKIIGCVLNCITNKNGKFQKKMYGRRYRYRYGYHYYSQYGKNHPYNADQTDKTQKSVRKKR